MQQLFDGQLPQFNIGTNNGESCDAALTAGVEKICAASAFSSVTNGRFRGGWITRHYGKPAIGVHALQMELAMSGYLHEQGALTEQLAHDAGRRARRHAGVARCATFSIPASNLRMDHRHEPHRQYA